VVEVRADWDGYLAAIDGRALGLLALDLGAGRKDRNDVLDLGVGLRILARVGQKVVKGDPLFHVLAKVGAVVKPDLYRSTLDWVEVPPPPRPWLLATIGC
jgi:thymidine phosphorylase